MHKPVTVPTRCLICGERLPPHYRVGCCEECGLGEKKRRPPDIQFAASGTAETYLGERIRANPDQAHLRRPRPALRPAINRLPRELIRRRP